MVDIHILVQTGTLEGNTLSGLEAEARHLLALVSGWVDAEEVLASNVVGQTGVRDVILDIEGGTVRGAGKGSRVVVLTARAAAHAFLQTGTAYKIIRTVRQTLLFVGISR